jgi:hypothetical protein
MKQKIFAAAVFALVCTTVAAEERLRIFEQRELAVAVPKGWSYDASRNDRTGVQTMTFTAHDREAVLLISFFPDPANALATKKAVLTKIEETLSPMLQGAVEKAVVTKMVDTSDGVAGHTTFTDRKLVGRDVSPGEWRTATAGIRSWPGAFAMFTLLSNDPKSATSATALDIALKGVAEVQQP